MLASGPPRARIARSSSGRGAHPAASTSAARIAAPLPFEVAAGRRSPRFCASLAPPPPPEPAAPPAPKNTVGAWLLASPTPKTVGQGYFGLIAANADAVSTVIDYLGTVPDVDPSRIAIGGTSTGGFIALEATAADARIRAAGIIAAGGDYPPFLPLSSPGLDREPADPDPTPDPRGAQRLRTARRAFLSGCRLFLRGRSPAPRRPTAPRRAAPSAPCRTPPPAARSAWRCGPARPPS